MILPAIRRMIYSTQLTTRSRNLVSVLMNEYEYIYQSTHVLNTYPLPLQRIAHRVPDIVHYDSRFICRRRSAIVDAAADEDAVPLRRAGGTLVLVCASDVAFGVVADHVDLG